MQHKLKRYLMCEPLTKKCRCGKLIYDNERLCVKCRTKKAKSREYIDKFLSQGICPRCKQSMDREGYVCSVCYKNQREVQDILRKQRKEQGLCVQCGKPAWEGHRFCKEHHDRHTELNNKRKQKNKNENI